MEGSGRGHWKKEGEGISQRTYINDPQTQTMVWGWPEGGGAGAGVKWEKGEKVGTTVRV